MRMRGRDVSVRSIKERLVGNNKCLVDFEEQHQLDQNTDVLNTFSYEKQKPEYSLFSVDRSKFRSSSLSLNCSHLSPRVILALFSTPQTPLDGHIRI